MDDVILELKDRVKGKSVEEGIKEIDRYFKNTIFSLEQDEWKNRMSKQQKRTFVKRLISS